MFPDLFGRAGNHLVINALFQIRIIGLAIDGRGLLFSVVSNVISVYFADFAGIDLEFNADGGIVVIAYGIGRCRSGIYVVFIIHIIIIPLLKGVSVQGHHDLRLFFRSIIGIAILRKVDVRI